MLLSPLLLWLFVVTGPKLRATPPTTWAHMKQQGAMASMRVWMTCWGCHSQVTGMAQLGARSSCFFTSPLEHSDPSPQHSDGELQNRRCKTCLFMHLFHTQMFRVRNFCPFQAMWSHGKITSANQIPTPA